MIVKENKPQLEKGINGAWVIAAVATQSISVLGTLLSTYLGEHRETVLFFTLCMFLVGCMLYLLLITTLAGARLILTAPESEILNGLLPFLKGFTLFFWAASWWIPLLVILGIWRHAFKRFPLRYDPQYWGMVFPLGMYTACTFQLSKAIGFEPLLVIPGLFIYIALAAWLATFVGLIHSQLKHE